MILPGFQRWLQETAGVITGPSLRPAEASFTGLHQRQREPGAGEWEGEGGEGGAGYAVAIVPESILDGTHRRPTETTQRA